MADKGLGSFIEETFAESGLGGNLGTTDLHCQAAAEAVLRQLATRQLPCPSSLPSAQTLRDGSEKSKIRDKRLHKAEVRYRCLVEQIPAITFMASLDDSINELYV